MDNPRKSIDLPWPAIAAAVVGLGGLFVYLNPLQTSRPAERTSLPPGTNHLENVDARLWQDPLQTAAEHETQIQKQKDAGTDSVEDSLHAVYMLRQRLSSLKSKWEVGRRAEPVTATQQEDDWVLAVMIPGGPYAEYSEARLRERQAVLEALGAEHYVPVDGEHIGYFKITRDEFSWSNMIIPFELCDRSGDQASANRPPSHVCVVWLREDEFQEDPISRLDWLLRDPTALGIDTAATLRTCIIGPSTSATLSAMMREVAEKEERGFLPGVDMWCATATASDELLMHQIRDLLHQIGEPENQTIEKYFARKTRSTSGTKPFAFHRSTLTDRDVIDTLVDEMGKNRGLKLNHDHIALISEWDTFYGRALPITFEHQVSPQPLDKLLDGHPPRNILIYHYLRGIDGRLPDKSAAGAAKTEETTKKDEGKKQSSLAREMTEGLNQADYLRRLARALVEQNEGFRRTGQSEIKAVGVLGSDVYDKLLVMEALRNSLPNAIFFTTSLDARLAHPDEWRWTRNLLVGSPFGLSLSDKYQDVPPFRESSQTAWYTATLLAAGNPALKKFPEIVDALRPVRLYEIGRKGAFDLTPCFTSGKPKRPQPPNVDMKRWLTPKRGILILCIGLFAVLAIAWSVGVILKDRSARKGGETSDTAFLRILGSPSSVFVIVGFFSVTLVWMISSCYKAFEGEPYSWNDGISIWPTETLRLLAALLSVFYIWRISTELWRSEQQVESKFGLPKSHKSKKRWSIKKGWRHRMRVRIRWLRLRVRRIKRLTKDWWSRRAGQGWRHRVRVRIRWLRLSMRSWWSRRAGQVSVRWECGDKGKAIDAAQLWNYYCASTAVSARALRIGVLVAAYIIAAVLLLSLLGFPPAPARGKWARDWDHFFLALTILSSVTLTFYVADVMLLYRRSIHYLMKNVTTWPEAAVEKLRNQWSSTEPRAPVVTEEGQRKFSPSNLLRGIRHYLMENVTTRSPAAVEKLGERQSRTEQAPVATEEPAEIPPSALLREYLDIDFIAHGTDFVGRQIYYPFIVISLLILSRSSIFDFWTWPVALLIIVCFNAGYIVFSFNYLRHTAEKARKESLKHLHDMLMAYTARGDGEEKEAKTIREATLLIQNEDRGAFAAISQQPLAKALLLPSGTAGIWALLQIFPRLFSS